MGAPDELVELTAADGGGVPAGITNEGRCGGRSSAPHRTSVSDGPDDHRDDHAPVASRRVCSLRLAEVRVVLADSASVANFQLSIMTDVLAPTRTRSAWRQPSAATWRRPMMQPTDNSGKAEPS